MSEWQPIESAPKNGKDLLLFLGGYCSPLVSSIVIGHWANGDEGEDWYETRPDDIVFIDVEVTHWMPLPEPPK